MKLYNNKDSEIKLNVAPVNVLYYIYITFFISIFIDRITNSLNSTYFFSSLNIILLLALGFLNNTFYSKVQFVKRLLFVFAVIFFIILTFVKGNHHYSVLLAFHIILIYHFISLYYISLKKLVDFLNNTYLVYVIFSILIFNLFPNKLYPIQDLDEHYVNLGFVKFLALHSIEGFASTIDTYSGLIFLVNIFLNKTKKSRKFYLLLSLFCIIYSLKMTPLVSIVGAFFAYLVVKRKGFSVVFILTILIIYIIILYFLFLDPKIYNVPFSIIMYAATHARSMLWVQQIQIMFENYDFFDYLFGSYSSELFSVDVYQIDGTEKEVEQSNPHNTYLLLFFRFPILFIVLYLSFLRKQYFNFNRKSFVIISFLFIAFLSNSGLISLGNPVYIILLSYLVVQYEKNTQTT